MLPVAVSGFDHVVLTVADAAASAAWYRDVLGLETLRMAEWEAGDAPFVSVRIDENTIIDLLEGERTGVNADHICLVVDDAIDLDELAASSELDVVNQPRRLYGARGWGRGFYIKDPDGNLVELRHYRES